MSSNELKIDFKLRGKYQPYFGKCHQSSRPTYYSESRTMCSPDVHISYLFLLQGKESIAEGVSRCAMENEAMLEHMQPPPCLYGMPYPEVSQRAGSVTYLPKVASFTLNIKPPCSIFGFQTKYRWGVSILKRRLYDLN
jgi:hypothetical protein